MPSIGNQRQSRILWMRNTINFKEIIGIWNTLLKQQKEIHELKVDIGNVYQFRNDIHKQSNLWTKIYKSRWFFTKGWRKFWKRPKELNVLIKTMSWEKNELKKRHNLLQVKFKALTMKEKDTYVWWDLVQDIIQKYIGKVYKMYEGNEKFYKHKIS